MRRIRANAMPGNNVAQRGFTMVELLVALSIMGLIVAFVTPAITSWMGAREAATLRTQVANAVALLPLKARYSAKPIILTNGELLNIDRDIAITVNTPIKVLATGYCVGGNFTLTINQRDYRYHVHAPYCEVELLHANS